MIPLTDQGWDKWFPRLRATVFLTIGMGIIVFEVAHTARLEVMLIGGAIAGLELPFTTAARIKKNGSQ